MLRFLALATLYAAILPFLVPGSTEGQLRGSAARTGIANITVSSPGASSQPQVTDGFSVEHQSVTIIADKNNAQLSPSARSAEPLPPSSAPVHRPVHAAIVLRAAQSLGQPMSRAKAEGLAAKMNSITSKVDLASQDPGFPGWEVNDWNKISQNMVVRIGAGFYSRSLYDFKIGNRIISSNFLPYASVGAATFAVIGAIAGLANGGDWSSAILNAGMGFAPFISMMNPIAGAIAVTFMCLFSPGQSSQFQALYNQIMKDVKKMIDETFVKEAMAAASNRVATIAKTWEESPWVLDNSSSDLQLRSRQLSFYQDQVSDFNNALPIIFGQDCVSADFQPKVPLTEVCTGFQRRGAITYQYHFAMQHLNVYVQYGSIDEPKRRPMHLKNLIKTAKIYYRLLSASYMNWLKYGEQNIPKCSYKITRPICPLGISCGYELELENTIDRNTGQSIPQKEGCTKTTWGPHHPKNQDCCLQDHSCKGSRCCTRSRGGEGPAEGCNNHDFTNYTETFKQFVTNFQPLVEKIKPLFCENCSFAESFETPLDDDGGGNMIYLDRHYVACPAGEAMTRWHLSRSDPSKIQFKYQCVNVTSGLGTCITTQTRWNYDGGGNVIYLDRHNLACPAGWAMTQWHLSGDYSGRSEITLTYTCCSVTSGLGTCRSKLTPLDDNGGWNNHNTIYLDRHLLECGTNPSDASEPADEVMTQWHLSRGGTGDKIQFEYTCCSLNPHQPRKLLYN